VDWSWPAWLISVAAVVLSGAIAWSERQWTKRPGLAMGFVNHGGMWSDLLLLSMANAVIVPHLTVGWWLAPALLLAAAASLGVHRHWYHPASSGVECPGSRESAARTAVAADSASGGDHMWPSHTQGVWWQDLSCAGWAHVVYVIGELTLLIGFLLHPAPAPVVLFVAAIFTIHVPIGLLQPRWFRTGHIATVQEQPLLAPLLLTLWAVTMTKL
jgi:hypothetical protein